MSSNDISQEMKSLIFTNMKPGQYMFSDHFNLEDTLPAIDIENSKMDRGMILIENEQMIDFVDSFFKGLPEKQIDTSEVLRSLFRLEMTWYTGKAYASDTLLTCVLLHRDPSVIYACTGNSLLSLALEATMTAASLMSYLIASSPVIREEDFHANLYGMNWWASTYAGGHFPRINPQTRELVASSGEARLQKLLDQLVQVCRQSSTNSFDKFYFARLYYWIRFLNDFIKATSIDSEFGSIAGLISDLQNGCRDDNGDEEEIILNDCDQVFYPQLANLFGTGCVRPQKAILSLTCSIKSWNRMIRDDLEGFLVCNLLHRRPRFHGLLKLLSERSRDPLKPPMLPITRSILYASLVQSRLGTVYQVEERDLFVSSSLPSVVSLASLPDLPLLLQDFIQVYLCTSARQRRFLPDLISAWDDRIIGKSRGSGVAGHRSVCWMVHLRDLLALDLVFLYGHLRLLDGFEECQAVCVLSSFFEKFRKEGKEEVIPVNILRCGRGEVKREVDECIDYVRWNHRWKLILKPLNGVDECDEEYMIKYSNETMILDWYQGMLRFGSTAFSLVEPDWQDDLFCTPKDGGIGIGAMFTMYTTTTEVDEHESEQD